MMHNKFAIFDRRVLVHESVNWTHHALISGDPLTVQDDE